MSELDRQAHKEVYRIYVTDVLRQICENTAKYAGGAYLTQRYADLISPEQVIQDERSGDEIVADLLRGLENLSERGEIRDNGDGYI